MQRTTPIDTVEEFTLLCGKAQGLITDIRDAEDYDNRHLPNAENIDLMSQHFVEYFSELNRDTDVFLYCTDGSRSKVAIRILKEMGFQHLYHLKNGINE